MWTDRQTERPTDRPTDIYLSRAPMELKMFPTTDDWVTDVQENLQSCEIDLTEEQIKKK